MKLDNIGFNQLKEAILKEENKLEEASTPIQVMNINHNLKNLKDQLKNATLVRPHNQVDKVDLGDVVKLYDYNFEDIFMVKLNANYKISTSFDGDIEETSINSPLGEQLFKKKVGDTITYSVDKREFKMRVEEIKKPVQLPIK